MSTEAARHLINDKEIKYTKINSVNLVSSNAGGSLIESKEEELAEVIVIVETIKESGISYLPILVNKSEEGEISQFLVEESKRLKKRLTDLRSVDPIRSHGKRRSEREKRDIREGNEKLIRQEHLEEKNAILEGREFKPLRLLKEGEDIKEFEIVEFSTDNQRRWWKYAIRDKELMQILVKLTSEYPSGIELAQEFYSLLWQQNFGYPEDMDKAEQIFKGPFRDKMRSVPEEHDLLMVPIYRIVRSSF